MELYKILFFAGTALCLIGLFLLVSIQLGMASKFGIYNSSFKNLNIQQIKRAKTSGYLFIVGVLALVLSMVARNTL